MGVYNIASFSCSLHGRLDETYTRLLHVSIFILFVNLNHLHTVKHLAFQQWEMKTFVGSRNSLKRRLSLSPVSAACFRPSSVRYLEQDIVEPRPDDYQSKKINYLNFSISFHLLNNMMTIGEGKYYLSILYIYIYLLSIYLPVQWSMNEYSNIHTALQDTSVMRA